MGSLKMRSRVNLVACLWWNRQCLFSFACLLKAESIVDQRRPSGPLGNFRQLTKAGCHTHDWWQAGGEEAAGARSPFVTPVLLGLSSPVNYNFWLHRFIFPYRYILNKNGFSKFYFTHIYIYINYWSALNKQVFILNEKKLSFHAYYFT